MFATKLEQARKVASQQALQLPTDKQVSMVHASDPGMITREEFDKQAADVKRMLFDLKVELLNTMRQGFSQLDLRPRI